MIRRISFFFFLVFLFLMVALPFKVMTLIPGFTDVRPVAALGPIYAIFYGPIGCFALACGNVLADIMDDALRWSSFAGFAANFLAPMAIWYGWKHYVKRPFSLRTISDLLFFTVLILFSAALGSAIITPAVAIAYPEVDATLLAWSIFVNNAVFPLVLGVPAMMLMQEEFGFVPCFELQDSDALDFPPVFHPRPRTTALPQNHFHTGCSYSAILLGDTHFDTETSVYHSDYNEPNEKLNRIQREEFARNADIWRERGPRLIAAALQQVQPDTQLVLHMGDLIQGDCGNPEVHKKMLQDSLELFGKRFAPLPFLPVVGNHDIRGTGAREAYHQMMPPFLTEQLHTPIQDVNFSFRHGPDLFLFLDFKEWKLPWIEQTLRDNQDARYKFVVTHGPILPSDCKFSHWYLLGRMTPLQRRLFRIFLQYNVIGLSGHTHYLELEECTTNEGQITQFLTSSVWSSNIPSVPEVIADSPQQYGSRQMPVYQNDSMTPIFDELRPTLTRYWFAQGAGFARLEVSDDAVLVHFFSCDQNTPYKTFRLR
ncbi:MAG: metallophosphoesterase [Victivallales bacterium]|nr:metallophosphoesterase [Victivallales bacterium]